MRVRRSPRESVVFIPSPRRLQNAGDVSGQSPVAEADTAKAEPPKNAPRPAANLASPDLSRGKLRLPVCLDNHGSSCHRSSPSLLRKGETELAQESLRGVVPPRRWHDGHVQAFRLLHLRIIDFLENQMILYAENLVAPAIERLLPDAT